MNEALCLYLSSVTLFPIDFAPTLPMRTCYGGYYTFFWPVPPLPYPTNPLHGEF
jgi:hypothetical protein